MKRFVAFVLVAVLGLGLAGCGSGAEALDQQIGGTMNKVRDSTASLYNEVKYTRGKEAAIFLELEEEINAEREAYNALSDKEKAKVKNAEMLNMWQKKIREGKMYQKFVGTWRDVNSGSAYVFDADGICLVDEKEVEWFFPEENVIGLNGWKNFKIVEEDGITKLIKENLPREELVRIEDYEALVDSGIIPSIDEFAGNWVELYRRMEGREDRTYSLLEDGTCVSSTGSTDQWKLWEDGSLYIDGFLYEIRSAEGFDYLVRDDEVLVKESEYDAFFDTYFVKVNITGENIRDYIGDAEFIGYTLDEWGEVTQYRVWKFHSRAYENGLVFIGKDDDFKYEMVSVWSYGTETDTMYEPFMLNVVYSTDYAEFSLGERATGTLTFARAEHVTKNYVADNIRYVELDNGLTFSFSNWNADWSRVTANYEDYMY